MANSFGSLYIGSSSLRNSQNALNTTANNLANVDTTGYVREQVLFTDKNYVTFNTTASISKQQYGLGVTIGDVVHARDVFLDKSYRTTAGREAFYETTYEATAEVIDYFQELEGEAFQDSLSDFSTAFATFSTDTGSTSQNLIIQKASLFLSRSQAIYSSLKSYQKNINTKISDNIDTINSLAKTISSLNKQIQTIESGGVETAMDLRDARDQALDELSTYGGIVYDEDSNGIVRVRFEGHEFIDENHVYEIGKQVDTVTGFVDPYWTNTSNTENDQYDYVYDLNEKVSTAANTDVGSLKALIFARGDSIANYCSLTQNADGSTMTADEYENGIAMSVMMNTEAEFDNLVHDIITSINDLLCPNSSMSSDNVYYDADGTALYQTQAASGSTYYLNDADGNQLFDASGNRITIAAGTVILDSNTASVGEDGELPPEELFVRNGCERYTEMTVYDAAGNESKVWVYNQEDSSDTSTLYSSATTSVNPDLLQDITKFPHLAQNGEIAQQLATNLSLLWTQKTSTLNPSDTETVTFEGLYEKLVSDLATQGNIFSTTTTTLTTSVLSIDNQRQQVIGVSTDEELTNMIKYQNAYNAASRYINVITTMIDTLISSMQ